MLTLGLFNTELELAVFAPEIATFSQPLTKEVTSHRLQAVAIVDGL
jgi:hypothetical protein